MGSNVDFKEPIYKLFAQIQDKPYFKKPKPLEGTLKRAIKGGSIPTTRRRDVEPRIAKL